MSDSSTSLVVLALGIGLLLLLGWRAFPRKYVGTCLLVGGLAFFAANWLFGLTDLAIRALGKDPTLTGRTEIWHEVLAEPINPLIGTGFESFWLGERYERFLARHWWAPNQAHNGYLETYINLGLIGLVLMLIVMVAAFWKARARLFRNFQLGRFGLGMLLMIVVYNWTEAAFKGLSFVWFVFFLVLIDFPQSETAAVLVDNSSEDGWETVHIAG